MLQSDSEKKNSRFAADMDDRGEDHNALDRGDFRDVWRQGLGRRLDETGKPDAVW